MNEQYEKIIEVLGSDRVLVNESMSKHSHIKIGGPADLFYIAKTRKELIRSVQLAIKLEVKFTVIGWASNTLIGDKGVRGLVIQNKYQEFQIVEELGVPEDEAMDISRDARQVEWEGALTYDFRDLDYTETGVPEVLINVSSGYSLPLLITKTLQEGITGLQWYARIPGSLAGAVYNNIHGGKKLFGPLVQKATIIDGGTGELKEVNPEYFGFAYDESTMHVNRDILVDVTLKLKRGNVEKGKWVQREWAKRKSVQPQNSLGCTFANPPLKVSEAQGYPSPSIGYFVEHVMGWNGKKEFGSVGMGRGYGHAAFIVNNNGATADEYIAVMDKVKEKYKEETGFKLRPEIFFLGEFNNKGSFGEYIDEAN